MKAKLPVLFIFFFTFCLAFGQTGSLKYLVLTNDQLKEIGFVINENGIFFRSELPKDKLNKDFIIITGYYNNKHSSAGITWLYKVKNKHDTLTENYSDTLYFGGLLPLKLDYYLIKIIEINGKEIYSSDYKNVETIPVFIKQSNYKFNNRNDIIVYLKATKNLKNKLIYIDKLDEYIVKF